SPEGLPDRFLRGHAGRAGGGRQTPLPRGEQPLQQCRGALDPTGEARDVHDVDTDPEHGAVLPRDEGPSDELVVATRCPTGAVVVSSAGRIGVARVGGAVVVGWTAVVGGPARIGGATVGRAVVVGAERPLPGTGRGRRVVAGGHPGSITPRTRIVVLSCSLVVLSRSLDCDRLGEIAGLVDIQSLGRGQLAREDLQGD